MNSLIGQHMLICWNYWLKLQSSARTVKGIKCYPIFQTTNWPAGCTDADRRHQTPSQEQRTRCDSQPHLQWEYSHGRDNPAVREPESFKMGRHLFHVASCIKSALALFVPVISQLLYKCFHPFPPCRFESSTLPKAGAGCYNLCI